MHAEFVMPPWLCTMILERCLAQYAHLPAHAPHGFTVGADDDPYLRRWFLLPRGQGPSCYLHQFLRDDDDRALHDHPWASIGLILQGGYIEHLPDGPVERRVGEVICRGPEWQHRIVLHRDGLGVVPAWTLFLVGERVREWGFHTADGWVDWQTFTAAQEV